MTARRVLYVSHRVMPSASEIDKPPTGDGWRLWIKESSWTACSEADRIRLMIKWNLDSGIRWLAWFRGSFPEVTWIAPWISAIESLGRDAGPELIDRALADDLDVVERCDGIALCGLALCDEMKQKARHGMSRRAFYGDGDGDGPLPFRAYDLTSPLDIMFTRRVTGVTFYRYADRANLELDRTALDEGRSRS
jgi:hypothetical protein